MFKHTKSSTSLLDIPSSGPTMRRSKSAQLASRSKSSKFRHSIIRAQMKLTNTKQSAEPAEIQTSKARLKCTKNITTSVEHIVDNLYWAQHEQARLVGALCDQLHEIEIKDSNDKFGIFLANMGRVHQNLCEIDEMYLMNMKDELVDPLKSFNGTQIKQCQERKLKLKTTKGEYDLMRHKDEHKALKLNELQSTRQDFIQCVESMELEKSSLLDTMQQYMSSYKAYALMHSTNIQEQLQMMDMTPPQTRAVAATYSDTEDCVMNDFNEALNTCNDWGKSSLIVKQGIFKKRGKLNKGFKKRWFKLFINKKLTYFELNARHDGPTGMLKGHANLSDIIAISTKKTSLIEIQTGKRTWVFQYDDAQHRDDWYDTFNTTCIQQRELKTIAETAYDFGTIFMPKPIPIKQASLESIPRKDIYNEDRRATLNGEEDHHVQEQEPQVLMSFHYPSRVTHCTIYNDGHTVQVNVPYESNHCVWCIRGERYVLRAFNFHTPSEHTINSQRYEMEMHLIHSKESDASQLAVLAFIFTPRCRYKKAKLAFSASGNHKVVVRHRRKKQTVVTVPEFTDEDEEEESEDDDTDVDIEWDLDEKYDGYNENDFLKQFWIDLPLRETVVDLRLSKSLNFDYLLSTASANFAQNVETNEICMDLPLLEYIGPLTTPPYTEGVQWFVSKNKHFIARKQLNKLSLCWGQL